MVYPSLVADYIAENIGTHGLQEAICYWGVILLLICGAVSAIFLERSGLFPRGHRKHFFDRLTSLR